MAARGSVHPGEGLHLPVQSVRQGFQRCFHVILRLQVQPELRLHVEIPTEPKRGVGGDAPAAVDNFVDASRRDADVFCQPVLTDTQWFKKLGNQDGLGESLVWTCWPLSMIIHDGNIMGIAALPGEADAPLLVDADAVLTLPITGERFQVI